ncbi:MAG: flagellar basal body P-ring protein FlgI [Deltaproteobacteria bacterium]|nr:flagellar basal body P-ring protein FlgI [Deltaproteobacteria bacterium]
MLSLLVLGAPGDAGATRLKDLVEVRGARDNVLLGYGLVVGLPGTGDTERVLFTTQAVSSMLGRLGVRVLPQDIRMRNVAGVIVTARLPAYVRQGTAIDVSVASLGNARTLTGGVLLATPLQGPDGKVYVVAQGEVQTGGYDVTSASAVVRKNQTASGRVPGGGLVERSVVPPLGGDTLYLHLKEPDFTTAQRIVDAVNRATGRAAARAPDPALVEVAAVDRTPEAHVALLSHLEGLEVEADRRARVVVSDRTGTVVAGTDVRIRPVAVAHGGLQVVISQAPIISQPNPLAGGRTVVVPVQSVDVREGSSPTVALPAAATVQDLVKALNTLGATPRDLVSILQAIKAAGALDADLEVI